MSRRSTRWPLTSALQGSGHHARQRPLRIKGGAQLQSVRDGMRLGTAGDKFSAETTKRRIAVGLAFPFIGLKCFTRCPWRSSDQPLRQLLMNCLRVSPASFCSDALALQVFIRSCCAVTGAVVEPATVFPLRQSLMKDLRASPDSFLAPASLLQVFIRACWGVGAVSAAWLADEVIRPTAKNRVRQSL